MFAESGQLLAVECLSRFNFNSEYAHFSPEQFFRYADSETRVEILLDQVNLIEKYKYWFHKNQVIATLNVDDDSLRYLANSRFAEKINAMRCIYFEISENETWLMEQYIHIVLTLDHYSFWLDDFRAGYAGFSALYSIPFRIIKLDLFLL